MCAAEATGIAPFGALGQGHFKEPDDSDKARAFGPPSAAAVAVSKVLSRIAAAKARPITSVALAYAMHKAPYVFPIVGGRKIEHLKANIEALGLELSARDMRDIDGRRRLSWGFRMRF